MIHHPTKLLILGAVWPEPNSTAAGSRMLQLMALFQQQGWQVTFATNASHSDHAADLKPHNIPSFAIEFNSPTFDSFVKNLNPDIVLFDRFMIEEQFGWRVAEQCPNALRILNTEDLHFLRKARHAAVKANWEGEYSAEIPHPNHLFSDPAKREIASVFRCDLSIIISQAEVELLTKTFKIDADLLHYTPLLPPAADEASWLPFAERQHFVTIGNFRHAPNWDGVLQLKEVVWPLIRTQLPEAELHIYGSYPPPKATALHNPRDRFLVKGWADDAAEVMRNARLCIAPLRFGAGLKGKFVLAMQCGTPSVTTPIGAEGLHGDLAWGGGIATDPESFAAAAIELYKNEAAWQQAQANGSAILRKRFDSAEHGQTLINKITQIQSTLTAHRHNNFMGAMLTHHTLQSTKYLSRWIEEKNRHE